MAGWRPVVEMQYDAFSYPCLDQLITHVGRYRWRTGGAMGFPLVVRMPYGGGVRAPELHDDSPETYYVHTPGVKVAVPATPADAKGLLAAAIRDPDPVVVLEPKLVYRTARGAVPDGEHVVALGRARVAREGSDVTLVAWGAMVDVCERAADAVAGEASVEVLDLRTLKPLDEEGIIASVRAHGPLRRRPGGAADVRVRLARSPPSSRSGRSSTSRARCCASPASTCRTRTGSSRTGTCRRWSGSSTPRVACSRSERRHRRRARRARAAATPASARPLRHVAVSSAAVAYEFRLPDLGEGLTEAEIARWLVAEGQTVEEDEPLVEVQTDKTTVEIPSPRAGTVLKILVEEGEIAPVGAVLVVIGEEGEQLIRAVERDTGAAAAPAEPIVAVVPPEPADAVRATPAVRRLARELGVELVGLHGTGPGGRITESDVRAAAGTGDGRACRCAGSGARSSSR